MDELFLQRCIELARQSGSAPGTNPRVGAVVAYGGRIVGEGFHTRFGAPHAEVEALSRVRDVAVLPHATLYVSLEPCCRHGKTPPCTDLILKSGIRRVVVGCLDPNPEMHGKGVEQLQAAGVEVVVARDPAPFVALNKTFFLNQRLKRPYILLKWAETSDGYIGGSDGRRLLISDTPANHYVHYLRSQFHAILIGKNTALRDDPFLNVRHYYGEQPIRIVLDIDLVLPDALKIFGAEGRVVVINRLRDETSGNRTYLVPRRREAYLNLSVLMAELYERLHIGSILVEGGRFLLQQFVTQNLYDEIQVLRAPRRQPGANIAAPVLQYNFKFDEVKPLGVDTLFIKYMDPF